MAEGKSCNAKAPSMQRRKETPNLRMNTGFIQIQDD